MKNNKNNKVVCILGMHRSGTSMVTRLLNICGLYLGEADEMMPAFKDNNEKGFWEHLDFYRINEEILQLFGGESTEKMPKFSKDWQNFPLLNDLELRAKVLIKKMNSRANIWGIKDPRFCLTLPFWKKLLPNMIFVIPVRNCFNVANSLKKRDGYAISRGVSLWTEHFFDIIQNTEGEKRILTLYDEYFIDWKKELGRLVNFIDEEKINFSTEKKRKEAEEFIDSSLRHNQNNGKMELEKNYQNIAGQESLCKHALQDFKSNIIFLANDLEDKNQENARLNQSIEKKEQEIQSKEQENVDLKSSLENKEGEITGLKSSLDNKDQEIAGIKSGLEDKDREILKLKMEIENKQNEILEIKSSLRWKIGGIFKKISDFVFENKLTSAYYQRAVFYLQNFSFSWDKISGNLNGPDFLIIGAQRSGTTSLFRYLSFHPQVLVPETKELHWFYAGPNGQQTQEWYEKQFPKTNNTFFDLILGKRKIKGEATPYYIFHPLVPDKLRRLYPKTKIIILLRDPIERAISQYFHFYNNINHNFFDSRIPIEEAFKKDLLVNPGEEEKIISQPGYYSYSHQHNSYVSRGNYKKQIARWQRYFPKKQMLVLQSEEFFENPYEILKKVCKFLKIKKYPADSKDRLTVYNKINHEFISEEKKKELAKYFDYI